MTEQRFHCCQSKDGHYRHIYIYNFCGRPGAKRSYTLHTPTGQISGTESQPWPPAPVPDPADPKPGPLDPKEIKRIIDSMNLDLTNLDLTNLTKEYDLRTFDTHLFPPHLPTLGQFNHMWHLHYEGEDTEGSTPHHP